MARVILRSLAGAVGNFAFASVLALALLPLDGGPIGDDAASCGWSTATAQDIPPPPAPCSGDPPASGPCPVCTTGVPGASAYQNSLPVPTPMPGHNYVVQLVNESNVTLLAAANAAHRGSSTPGGPIPSPVAVTPREGTWVLLPKGSPNDGNILTIDIPVEWEGTQCPQDNRDCGANGPRVFARTGCAYDIAHNLAQCETGSCGDAYDCGRQALRDPPLASAGQTPLTIVEWTFNSQGGQGYVYPDISLVDGVSLTVDVQAIGEHCASKPGDPHEPNWLSENQPLSLHGSDLREADRCIPSFRLTRGEVGLMIAGSGNPDDVVACFTNCGRYEYPQAPDPNCDPASDERCRNWRAFCCFAPAGDPDHIYGGTCTDDGQCAQAGACWNLENGQASVCACRGFLKQADCPADVCTHPNPPNVSAQPPFGLCTDVTDDPDACIGDDAVHAVFPGGYTWPNDPQTYVSDARAYRVIFAPGGTSVPITDSGPIPDCSALPDSYGYATQAEICRGVIEDGALFAGAAQSPACESNDDCPFIPGSTPPVRSACDPQHKRCATWSCQINPGGPVSTGASICRWPSQATPSPTPTLRPGPLPATPPAGDHDDGCAVVPPGNRGGLWLLLPAVLASGVVRRALRASPPPIAGEETFPRRENRITDAVVRQAAPSKRISRRAAASPEPIHSFSSRGVHHLLEGLSALGIDRDAVCREAGLAAHLLRDPVHRVETRILLRLFDGAEARSGDRLIGLHLAERVRYGGLATSLLGSQNTLAEAVRAQGRFQALLLGANAVAVEQRGALTHVILNAGSPPARVRHLAEYCIASSCRLMRWLTQDASRPEEVFFRHSPGGPAAEYERVFGCPVRFGTERSGAALSGAALAVPLLSANEQLAPQLERLVHAEIAASAPRALRDAVAASLRVAWRDGASPRREAVARRLGISPRTLQRRLETEHTSFAAVLDETRRETALALLADPACRIGDVSRNVGYADQFAFNKAFRRWTGVSPSAYRRREST